MASSFKNQFFCITLALLIAFAASARLLDQTVSDADSTLVSGSGAYSAGGAATTVSGGGTVGTSTVSGGGASSAGGATTTVSGGGNAGTSTVSGGRATGTSTVAGGGASEGVPDGMVAKGEHPALTFFMHDILGGTNPSAKAITGIVTNPAVNGQVPFAKPNGAVLPTSNGLPQNNANNGIINNNNVPFLTGLGGVNQNVLQNNGNNNNNNFVGGNGFPVMNGAQLSAQSSLQQLMFGTMIAIDDELTESHDLGSGMVGRAQGYYVYSSVDGKSQSMAITAMFQEGGYVDSINFFGVHQTSVSESLIAVMGGTGKYVNAKGCALVKTLTGAQQQTDGLETVLEFNVFLSGE